MVGKFEAELGRAVIRRPKGFFVDEAAEGRDVEFSVHGTEIHGDGGCRNETTGAEEDKDWQSK